MISIEDYFWFVDAALDDIVAIVTSLGDELANQSPALAGANSPYAILTHCLGVMEGWGGEIVAGRTLSRDRPSEFVATGRVADLAVRAREARAQLGRDVANVDPRAKPVGQTEGDDTDLWLGESQGRVLFHIYEELAQHRGQLEITRDILLAP
jgi:Protein of unknown function (DUF664)